MTFGKLDEQSIDPYVAIDVDQQHLDRSTTKTKTSDPVWNELFVHNVQGAVNLGLTVFHDSALPPDDFVANCTIAFDDLLQRRDQDAGDCWVCLTRNTLSVIAARNAKFNMFTGGLGTSG